MFRCTQKELTVSWGLAVVFCWVWVLMVLMIGSQTGGTCQPSSLLKFGCFFDFNSLAHHSRYETILFCEDLWFIESDVVVRLVQRVFTDCRLRQTLCVSCQQCVLLPVFLCSSLFAQCMINQHICILLCAHTCRQWTRVDASKPVVRELNLASANGVKTFICARTINQVKYGMGEW